jgi:hypothetical protein
VENRAQAYERLGNYNLAIAGEDIVHARVRVSTRPHLRCFTFSFRYPSSRAPSVTFTRSSALLVRFFLTNYPSNSPPRTRVLKITARRCRSSPTTWRRFGSGTRAACLRRGGTAKRLRSRGASRPSSLAKRK